MATLLGEEASITSSWTAPSTNKDSSPFDVRAGFAPSEGGASWLACELRDWDPSASGKAPDDDDEHSNTPFPGTPWDPLGSGDKRGQEETRGDGTRGDKRREDKR